jgi:hypothetical protein
MATADRGRAPPQKLRTTVRHGSWTVLVSFLLGCAGGCALPAHSQGPSWFDCARAGGQADPNAVTIETTLLELKPGDPYISQELWQDTDELVVGLELRERLRDNGLRVGQLIGTPPVGFQTMLLSPQCCTHPKRLLVPSGKMIPQYASPVVLPHCSFEVVLDAGKTELEADQVRFCFDVVPTLTADGRTRLSFTPKVETGENLLPFQASPEQSSWVLRIERPSRKYPELGWEVTLAPGEYVVIGCRPEKKGSFGASAFIQDDESACVQRLLVIRTNRALPTAAELAQDDMPRIGPAPLAVQAAQPVARGQDR